MPSSYLSNGIRIDWNFDAFSEIRNCANAQDMMLELAQETLAMAEGMSASGVTYKCDVQPGVNRCHAMVKTTDAKSIASNAKHNSLIKSVQAVVPDVS